MGKVDSKKSASKPAKEAKASKKAAPVSAVPR